MADDYSVAKLDELKKQMAHNAIKTTLQLDPVRWDGDAESGFYGAGWDGRLPPVSGPTGKVRLKWYPGGLAGTAGMPPGVQKVGDGADGAGQAYVEYELDPWADIYDPWIQRIDDAFLGWDSIPDPADFEGPINSTRSAVLALTAVPTEGDGDGGDEGEFQTKYTGVELTSNLATMEKFLDPSYEGNAGRLVYTFYNAYGPQRIAGVMQNQSQAAIILGVALLGEQRVWQGARTTVMAIAEQAAPAFKYGGAGGDSIDLDVVKAFVDLVKVFAPPQVAPVLEAGGAAISLVQALAPETPNDTAKVYIEGWSPDEVYESLKQAMKDLEKSIYDHEYELATKTLNGMLSDMQGMDRTDWHIHPDAGLAPQLENAPDIGQQTFALKEIGYDICSRIGATWGHAAEEAQAANKSFAWQRSGLIGYGSSGAYPQWLDVLELFDDVTTGSGQEIVQAGKLLAQGAGYMEDTDGYVNGNLSGVQDDLDRGDLGYDGELAPAPAGPYGPGRPGTPY